MRWLLSCVPTRDDLRRPRRPRRLEHLRRLARRRWREKPWWRERIRSALASYWVYQHLGNLPAEELAADPDYRAVLRRRGRHLAAAGALADRADAEADGRKGVRFSFRWDLGATRFVMIDSRNGRILDGGAHLMLGERSSGGSRSRSRPGGADVEHLVLGTSLPWLLPHAIGDLQSINSARGRPAGVARPARRDDPPGRRPGALAGVPPVVRPAHADGRPRPRPGPTRRRAVSVLSGDVHHSYAARVDLPGPGDDPGAVAPRAAAVHQLTCSPVHNVVDWFIRPDVPPGLVDARSRRLTRLVGAAGGRAADRACVAQARGPAVRQHDRDAGAGRAARRGDVRAAAVGGHAGARSRGSSWWLAPTGRARTAPAGRPPTSGRDVTGTSSIGRPQAE